MKDPKFMAGQLVKYTVNGETRYNNITGVIWHPDKACYTYRLEEKQAMPIHSEADLELVSNEEKEMLYNASKAGTLVLHDKGYLTVKEKQPSKENVILWKNS